LVPTISTILLVEAFGDELVPFFSQSGSIALALHHPIPVDGVLKGFLGGASGKGRDAPRHRLPIGAIV
jgi:hypothetical protein